MNKMVQAIQKFSFSMVLTISKPNKMGAILSTLGKPNTIGKHYRPWPFEFLNIFGIQATTAHRVLNLNLFYLKLFLGLEMNFPR